MTRLRQLWLLTALGTLAALAGGYFLLVSPQNTKAAALREEAEEQLQVNRQLQSQINQLNKQKKDLPAQQALLARFAGLIPSNPAMPRLIRALTDAADNSGVELVSITPSLPEWAKGVNPATRAEVPGKVAAPDGQSLVDIPVNIRVVGEYSQMTQFFTEIEEMNRALLVAGFKVERPKKPLRTMNGDGQTKVDPNLLVADLSAHVMMTKKAAPAAAATAPKVSSDTDALK
jgi:Tfp pilus assembly protein PilO